jgi:hypothetical protein
MCPNLKYEIAPLTFMQFSPRKTPYFEKKSIQLDEWWLKKQNKKTES